jgi:hypothetical protein
VTTICFDYIILLGQQPETLAVTCIRCLLGKIAKGECEVKKNIRTAARMSPLLLALAMFCASPTDKDVKWRSSVDLPITDSKKFFLGAMMDTLFFDKKQVKVSTTYDTIFDTIKVPRQIVRVDSLFDTTMMLFNGYPRNDTTVNPARVIRDTVTFGFPSRDSVSDTISEDSLEDKRYGDVFGPIPLSGAPLNNLTVNFPAVAYTSGTPVSLPGIPLKLKWVYHVELSNTAQVLNVNVTNNSDANFSRVIIDLGGFGRDTIDTLMAHATAAAHYNAQAKVIDTTDNITISFTPSGTGTFAAGNNLSVGVSLGGLTANKVVIFDSLLAGFQRTFTNEYKITDTVDVDYIDIDEGVFVYQMTNHTGVTLNLNVVHRNLWRTSFCAQRNLVSAEDLLALSKPDSSPGNYFGNVLSVPAKSEPDITKPFEYKGSNISKTRMFPHWNPITKKSVTIVDYIVKIDVSPTGNKITLASNDSLSFVIKTAAFKFGELYGTLMETSDRSGDASAIPINLPFSRAVTDSLRGNFKLQKVLAKVKTQINLPEGAFIDTVKIRYEILSTSNPAVKCSSETALLHVTRDSIYERSIDITQVVNDYPDSVKVRLGLTIPTFTKLKVVNDLKDPTDPNYSHYIGRMMLRGKVGFNLVAPLSWTVVDTTIMDLGGNKADLGGASGALDPFAKMDDRHASINLQVTNFTNVYMRLYALVATDSSKIGILTPSDTTDTIGGRYITTNQFSRYLKDTPTGFVNLLNTGFLIPPRDSITAITNNITLTEKDLGQVLSAKKIGLRWQVRFLPQPTGGKAPDQLNNTDWIKLNSWFHIDGVSHIDSLFK